MMKKASFLKNWFLVDVVSKHRVGAAFKLNGKESETK